jgi:D-glycero-alpha-D-manno-heptose-7-phosphate kinase
MVGEKRFAITKTPLRLSFAGGGTDIPDYYRTYGTGAVVSGAMNRYVYAAINENFYENSIKVRYAKVENDVTDVNEIEHPSVRESLRLLGITNGVEVTAIADIPSRGTGLGSSSSFAVGLLNALHAYKGDKTSPKSLAEEAIKVEREILKEAGGKQDQYIAAFGGIRLMEFKKDDTVDVSGVKIGRKELGELEKHLLLMYTGKERSSSTIHVKQASEVGSHVDSYRKMVELAHEQFEAFESGKWQETGRLLHENWMLKKTLASGISDQYIDRLYNTALQNGAEGGKIMGAGGGGFLLFFADPDKHQQIINALPELKAEHFSFDMEGSRVIYNQGDPGIGL